MSPNNNRIETHVDDNLAAIIDFHAKSRGLTQADAVRELLQLAVETETQPTRIPTIWEVIPQAKNEADLNDLIHGDDWDIDGEYCEAETSGLSFSQGYGKKGGWWIYTRNTELPERDSSGMLQFRQEYIVCADQDEARCRFGDGITECLEAWDGASPLWGDCGYDDDAIDWRIKAGYIPAETLGR